MNTIYSDFTAVDLAISNTRDDMTLALESLGQCKPGSDGFDEFDLELIKRSIRGLEIVVSRVTGKELPS